MNQRALLSLRIVYISVFIGGEFGGYRTRSATGEPADAAAGEEEGLRCAHVYYGGEPCATENGPQTGRL